MALSLPLRSKVLSRNGSTRFMIGSATMQGWKSDMCSEFSISLRQAKHPNKAAFGIFDGSQGDLCARWLAANLFRELDGLSGPTAEELGQTCEKLNSEFLRKFVFSCASSAFLLTETSDHCDGSALVGIVGGCHVLTCQSGKIRCFSSGSALSREFGEEKSGNVTGEISSEGLLPILAALERIPIVHGEFVLLVSDSVLASSTPEKIVEFIEEGLKSPICSDPAMIVALLLDEMLYPGCIDNLTAMLILFQDGAEYHCDDEEYLPGPYLPSDEIGEPQHSDFVRAYGQFALHHGFTPAKSVLLESKNRSRGYYPPTHTDKEAEIPR